jgi:phosphatidylglycerol:prolipoprotein diacylglycerol transferase
MSPSFDWAHLQWHLDPIAISIGPLAVRWYGLMYAVAISFTYWLTNRRLASESWEFTREHIDAFLTWLVLGILIGGRLGYVFFYGWGYFSQHPLEIILPVSFQGGFHFTGISGMSYHGGVLGVTAAVVGFALANKRRPLRLAELMVPTVPLGYTFGRLGNFLNGELWGRPTDVPWGMHFPHDPKGDAFLGKVGPLRHPSQLYEAIGEGLLLWAFLWAVKNRAPFRGRMVSCYLMGYGLVRFFIEFTREPDAQLGFLLGTGWLTMGQVLCLVMVAIGFVCWFFPVRGNAVDSVHA